MNRLNPVDGPAPPDPSSELRRMVWVLWGRVTVVGVLAHAVFLGVFVFLDLPMLAGLNVVSIAMYLGCRRLFASGRPMPAVALLVGEVLLHAAVATHVLGLVSGFHFYILTLVLPLLITLAGPTPTKLLWIAGIGLCYGLLDRAARDATPLHALDPAYLEALRYFNLTGMLAITTFVSLTHHRMVIDLEQSLRQLATTDSLTGLHNRRRMLEIARREQADHERHPRGLCVLLCDIDNFKSVNDLHGHEVGDRALRQVSQALHASLRDHDLVARWGGEEFLVLVTDADLGTGARTAERMRHAVARTRVELPGRPALTLTVTIGVAQLGDGDTVDAAIARADTALYHGKASGRDRVFTETDTADSASQALDPGLDADLRPASADRLASEAAVDGALVGIADEVQDKTPVHG